MRYYIIAGEASGDLHGSNLIRGLRQEDPEAEFRIWGGQLMLSATFDGGSAPVTATPLAPFDGGSAPVTAAPLAPFDGGSAPVTPPGSLRSLSAGEGSTRPPGSLRSLTASEGSTRPPGSLRSQAASESATKKEILVRDYREGAVMGLTDVLAKAGKLLGNLKFCKNDILAWKPDVVILIDYPGFNMKIAKFCHNKGIRVFYYIAPKTWASRENRNRKLKRWVDRLYIVFPFEVPYFEKTGIPFEYVGNPLLDAVDNHEFTPVTDGPYIALLAGSRASEISRMMPVCMQVADTLGCKFVIAGAPARSMEDYSVHIGGRKNVEVVFGRTYDVLRYASAAIINSGTASLEAALIGTPQVVCWSTSKLTAFVARNILHVLDNIKYISLGNLCIDKCAFRELIQEEFTAENVTAELRRLTSDEEYRERMLNDYADIRQSLGGDGASRAVAKAIIKELR